MKKGTKKFKKQVSKSVVGGWDIYFDSVMSDKSINVGDYNFLAKQCKLSEGDTSLFMQKILDMDGLPTDNYSSEQYATWYSDFVARMSRLPLLSDYFDFEEIISSY